MAYRNIIEDEHILIPHEGDPYRAAVWTSPDGQREMALTTREQSHLSDDDLLAAGCEWAEANDLTCCTDEISVQSFA